MALVVQVNPSLLRWARERAAMEPHELAKRLKFGGHGPQRVLDWETTGRIQLNHLERLASKTYIPVGYLFLNEPPEEALPIADFRTSEGSPPSKPSADLLDTLYACQIRQEWFREFQIESGEPALSFVGSASPEMAIGEVASAIRSVLQLRIDDWARNASRESAFEDLTGKAEAAGILVMRNGVVGANTRRKLNPREFLGFTLSDSYAPLVFLNWSDPSKSRRNFTLAHELVHVWLGDTGVSSTEFAPPNARERFCNAVAAELLVPMEDFRSHWTPNEDSESQIERLAKRYKVSSFVLLIRAREAGFLSQEQFDRNWSAHTEAAALRADSQKSGGSNFYLTQRSRLGSKFLRSVASSALEGRTTYRDALRLAGVSNAEVFHKLAARVGVRV